VESESDEEPVAEEPRLRGALRGLDMSNMLAPADTHDQTDTGEDGRQSMPADTPQHQTRASRHGKTPVNYSAKWHPMDEVMRPKRARGLAGGSTSRRRAGDCSDDSEPEPFSGGDTGDEDDAEDMPNTPFEREPDAGATRRSARSEARKPVNYSKAHHPQDHLLPGYRNRAKRQRRSTSATQPRKRKTSGETIVLLSQTLADSDSDSSDTSEGDCIQLQAADPATIPALSPREPSEDQKDRTMPTDVYDDSHHIDKAVPSLSHGESSFDSPDAIVLGLLTHIDQPELDSQHSSQAVNRNRSDDETASQNTKALMANASVIFASVEDPDAIGSGQVAEEQVQQSSISGHHNSLRVSRHATVTTSLLTLSSAMEKSTQARSPGLKIVLPYSTPQVEPSVNCQPSSSQRLKDADVAELDVLPNKAECDDKPMERQERDDALNSQDDPSQTERHTSSEAARDRDAARDGLITRGFSDVSSRVDIASHDPGDCMTAMSPASRQASRETQPETILAGESFFLDATSSSQSSSKESHEDEEPHASTVVSPKLPESGQEQVEGNAHRLQLVSDGEPLVSVGDDGSNSSDNGPQRDIQSEENRVSESAEVPKEIQSPPVSSVPAPAELQAEVIASSSTQSDDSLMLGGIGM
jgi:hypothetical protein